MTQPLVLIVEDEAPLQELLTYNLQRADFDVEQAFDGDQALDLVVERTPDLILLDWMLPRISGIELCRQFRRKSETAGVPIVMLTARAEESDRLRGLNTGADDYITKPFSVEELIARIRAVLRRVRPAFADELLTFADLTMDLAAHRVTRCGDEVHLAPSSSACCASSWSGPAGFYRAISYLTWSGAMIRTSSCVRWTPPSGASDGHSMKAATLTSCEPPAPPATPSTTATLKGTPADLSSSLGRRGFVSAREWL